MRAFLGVVAAVCLLGAGFVAGILLEDEPEPATLTEVSTELVTTRETVTAPATGQSLPAAVAAKRDAILAAAEAKDYDALAGLADEGFRYSFGGPVEGGVVAFWKELEATTDDRPIEDLAAILEMPYTLSQGYYVWPFVYDDTDLSALSEHEIELLQPIVKPGELEAYAEGGSGWLGWRTGITPDGRWEFFVAGD